MPHTDRAKARARFRRLEPYGLYPVDEYFGGPIRREPVQPLPPPVAVRPSKVPYFQIPLAA